MRLALLERGRQAINADVINHNIGRIRSHVVGSTGPVATDCKAEHHVERLIKDPLCPLGEIARLLSKVDVGRIIDIKLHHLRRPDYAVRMEPAVIYAPAIRKSVVVPHGRLTKIPWSMNRRSNGVWSEASTSVSRTNILHDVYGPGLGPIHLWESGPHKPERRPQARPNRKLHPRFNSSVLKVFDAARAQARRGPGVVTVFRRPQNQLPGPIEKHGLLSRDAVCTSRASRDLRAIMRRIFLNPARGFRSVAARAIELIAPTRFTPRDWRVEHHGRQASAMTHEVAREEHSDQYTD